MDRHTLRTLSPAVVAVALTIALLGAGQLVDASTGRAGKAPARGTSIQVMVELFRVALVDQETIRYRRDMRALDPRGPDTALADLMKGPSFLAGTPAIIHSTSWRYQEDGTVVLTYLAFGEGLAPRAEARPEVRTVRQRDLPQLGTTDPDKPRPPTIKYEDVLAHGLRHLALLARRTGNDAFAKRLGLRSRNFFASLEPEVAGEIRNGASYDRSGPDWGAPR
jgi:hypothetical protein